MARIEQTVTIKFDPKDLDRLVEAIRSLQVDPVLEPQEVEPITITTPDGRSTAGKPSTTTERYLFIDGLNQQHWVSSVRTGRDRGWRQAFFQPGR